MTTPPPGVISSQKQRGMSIKWNHVAPDRVHVTEQQHHTAFVFPVVGRFLLLLFSDYN